MDGQSVLKQKPASAPAKPAAAPAEGGSVLGGGPKKPITFYKKAWFWIIIAVVVLGIAALIVFLVINANLAAEAVEKYGENAKAASNAATEFERKFSSAYNDSGLPGYYTSSNSASIEMRDKCLEKFDVDPKVMDEIDNIKTFNGETAVEEFGSGKTRELSDKFKKATEGLKKATEGISDCEKMMTDKVAEDVDITIGSFKYEKKGNYIIWIDTELPVTVKNKTNETRSFSIEITAYDKSDKKIEAATIYVNRLTSGDTADKKAFTYVSDSVAEKLKDATFKVTKISESD